MTTCASTDAQEETQRKLFHSPSPGTHLALSLLFAGMLCCASSASTQIAPAPANNQIVVDNDGALHIPPQTIPMSNLMSPELKKSLIRYLTLSRDPKYTARQPDGSFLIHKAERDRQDELYPVEKAETQMGGVHVIVITPNEGVTPEKRDRVLIQLHSAGCWTDCAQLGSQPIANLGKIKIVTVDYREPQFPTAVTDVTNVYKALLNTYKPENIGIYGCSRGGVLVARSLAWFQMQKLPRPAAAGILCASAGGERGDAAYVGSALGNGTMTRGGPQVDPDLGNIDPNDPLVSPVNAPDILSKFPPTLMIAGGRGVELSTAAYTHQQFVRLGVESDFHVFEGGRHSFWYDP